MKFRIADKIKGVLTEPQVTTLLNQAKALQSEWYPHWSLALYTGMRNGELYALTWDKGDQAKHLRMFLEGPNLPRIRFHNLRATWAIIMLSKGVEPIKVMKMGGWKDLKTTQIYVRKSGVDIKGIASVLNLHNPSQSAAEVLNLH